MTTETKTCPDCQDGWVVQTGGEQSVKVICPTCRYASLPQAELEALLAEKVESLRSPCKQYHAGIFVSQSCEQARCPGYVYSGDYDQLRAAIEALGWEGQVWFTRGGDTVVITNEKEILGHTVHTDGITDLRAIQVALLRAVDKEGG